MSDEAYTVFNTIFFRVDIPRLWGRTHSAVFRAKYGVGAEAKQMMKITCYKEEETLTLKLEGGLTSSWVEELKGCWQAASDMKNVQHIQLDLSEVTFVDDEGKEFLALVHHTGGEILATNVLTKFIVEEIAERKGETA